MIEAILRMLMVMPFVAIPAIFIWAVLDHRSHTAVRDHHQRLEREKFREHMRRCKMHEGVR